MGLGSVVKANCTIEQEKKVEAFAQMNEKGREEWLKLTGDSKTTTASRSVSSDGSHRLDALYTFAKGTIMSASALLNNSSVNLQS